MPHLRNVQTNIPADTAGTMVVNWDLLYRHDFTGDYKRHDEVAKINYVEFHLFDRVGVDFTDAVVCDRKVRNIIETILLGDVENKRIDDIQENTIPQTIFDLNKAKQDALSSLLK